MDAPAPHATTLFRRGHDPAKVGAAIVTAIERDRAIALVGPEAWVGWGFSRLLPVRLQQRLANDGLGRLTR